MRKSGTAAGQQRNEKRSPGSTRERSRTGTLGPHERGLEPPATSLLSSDPSFHQGTRTGISPFPVLSLSILSLHGGLCRGPLAVPLILGCGTHLRARLLATRAWCC